MPHKFSFGCFTCWFYLNGYVASCQDFDFLGHDSAFKDRNVQLQSVRVAFIPTTKTDIRDLGPMDEVVFRVMAFKRWAMASTLFCLAFVLRCIHILSGDFQFGKQCLRCPKPNTSDL
jgi:hypothetical protein